MPRIIEPNADHTVFHTKLRDIVADEIRAEKLTNFEILAITSQIVGLLVAIQDQRTNTPENVMATVANNIEIGNKMAIETMFAGIGKTKQ